MKELKQVLSVVPSRAVTPLHTYVRAQVKPTGASLQVHGDNLSARIPLPGLVAVQEVDVLVPGKLLEGIVGSLQEPELTFGERELTVREGRFFTTIRVASPEGFPEVEPPSGSVKGVQVDKEALRQALSVVAYATSTESYRGVFRGIQLELHPEGKGRAVASDGYRLAMADFPLGAQGLEQRLNGVLPKGAAKDALKLLSVLEGDQVVLFLERGVLHITDVLGQAQVSLFLMEGSYPDYTRVIPRTVAAGFVVEAKVLREAIGRLLAVAPTENFRGDFSLWPEGLRLRTEGDYGQAEEFVEVEARGELSFSFNLRYLLEALEPIEDQVDVSLSGKEAPTLVRPVSPSGVAYSAVVVPLKV